MRIWQRPGRRATYFDMVVVCLMLDSISTQSEWDFKQKSARQSTMKFAEFGITYTLGVVTAGNIFRKAHFESHLLQVLLNTKQYGYRGVILIVTDER